MAGKSDPSLAVSLSGGGHRATLFTLGALMYLVDSGANKSVTSIASVSGGSITNALVGQTLRFRAAGSSEFDQRISKPLAYRIANNGTLFAPALVKLYIALLVVLGLSLLVIPFTTSLGPCYVRFLLWVAVLLIGGWLAGKRGSVCAYAFKKTLFSTGGKATHLKDLQTDGLDHVICSTELRSAEQVYFSGSFIYSYCFGHAENAADLELARAVQASACFPGGFPPAVISNKGYQFSGAPTLDGCGPRERNKFVMTDGGVYDNMGDQWARGFEGRLRHWPELGRGRSVPELVIVVNASARFPWTPYRFGWIPLVNEILAIVRMNDVMYVNTTNVRRQEITQSYNPVTGQISGKPPGVLVQISQSPFAVPVAFQGVNGPVGDRAREVMSHLGNTREKWQTIASENSRVATELGALGKERSAQLVYQGYVVAMSNLYVLFGNSFPFFPNQLNSQRFWELVA
jgi:hypothetical protein